MRGQWEGAGTRLRTGMLLRHRLALLVATSLVVAFAASVVLTELVFGQIQHRQSSAMVERELARVQAVVRSGSVGEDIVAAGAGSLELQFVTSAGVVALPVPGSEPLLLHEQTSIVRSGDEAYLLASAPWVLPSGLEIGTIRVALDLRDVAASRRTLRTSLVVSGVMILLIALFGALVWLRRSLAPLSRLAAEAERMDPTDPRMSSYVGPDDEVARVAAALDSALGGIRARRQAERDALAEVAHELAAPLTVVAGQLRALESSHPHDHRLNAARAAADELLHTAQDLLTLARGELDAQPDLSVVDVADIADQIADEYPGVRVERSEGDTRVLANPERLRQVTRNLVRNAVQAAGRGAGVLVRTEREGEHVACAVADDGPGIPEESQSRIFERYMSGSAGSGAGVGLTVAKRIVEALDGTLEVWSVPGAGTVFTVTFPHLEARLDSEAVDAGLKGRTGEDSSDHATISSGEPGGLIEGSSGATAGRSARKGSAQSLVGEGVRTS